MCWTSGVWFFMPRPEPTIRFIGGYHGLEIPELDFRIYRIDWIWDSKVCRFSPMLLEWNSELEVWDDASAPRNLSLSSWLRTINYAFGTQFTSFHFPPPTEDSP